MAERKVVDIKGAIIPFQRLEGLFVGSRHFRMLTQDEVASALTENGCAGQAAKLSFGIQASTRVPEAAARMIPNINVINRLTLLTQTNWPCLAV